MHEKFPALTNQPFFEIPFCLNFGIDHSLRCKASTVPFILCRGEPLHRGQVILKLNLQFEFRYYFKQNAASFFGTIFSREICIYAFAIGRLRRSIAISGRPDSFLAGPDWSIRNSDGLFSIRKIQLGDYCLIDQIVDLQNWQTY